MAADTQNKPYQQLSAFRAPMNLAQAQAAFAKLQKDDPPILGVVCKAAEYGKLVRAGERPNFAP